MSCWVRAVESVPETYWAGMPEARIRATPRLATSRALPASTPERSAGPAERTGVRVVADIVVQEVEDVLGVVIRAPPPLPGCTGRSCWRRASRPAGWDRRAGRERRGGRRVGNRAGRRAWQRPERPCRAARGGCRLKAGPNGDRHAGPVVALDRAQAPGQVLPALIGLLRGAQERHARGERIGQEHAGLGIGRLVVDRVSDGLLVVLNARP